jgi:hypothetical protein
MWVDRGISVVTVSVWEDSVPRWTAFGYAREC